MKTMRRIIDVALLNETLGEAIQSMFCSMNYQISQSLNSPVHTMESKAVDFGLIADEVSFQKNFKRK